MLNFIGSVAGTKLSFNLILKLWNSEPSLGFSSVLQKRSEHGLGHSARRCSNRGDLPCFTREFPHGERFNEYETLLCVHTYGLDAVVLSVHLRLGVAEEV